MNERIEDLLGQAYDESVPETWTTLSSDQLGRIYEKFAELIVRECVAICQDIDGEDNIDARSGRQDCAVEIREHFGVEE